jgi:hypothetical protein
MGGDGLKKLVMPLTIITIHDLENLECSIGQFGLRDFLFDYTNDCPHGIRSVHNYLFFSKYKNKLKPPVVIMNMAEGLMDRARQALFPVVAAAEGEVPEA